MSKAEQARERVMPVDPTPGMALYAARESRDRVEIRYEDGQVVRCYVGMSTGWRPCFLAVHNSRSLGGGPLNTTGIVSVKRTGRKRA